MRGRVPILAIGLTIATLLVVGVSSCTSDGPSSNERTGPTKSDTKSPDDAKSPEKGDPSPKTTKSGTEPPQGDKELSEDYANLLRTAQREGKVSIIVELELESTPGTRAAHQQAIEDAQRKMFDQLQEFEFQERRVYDRWPRFSADVDEAGLRFLFDSPDVAQIWKNTSGELE